MSEKMTRLNIPGATAFPGLLDWGDVPAEKMVRLARAYADRLRAEAAEIDACADAEFRIDVVRGSIVQHQVRSVQPGFVLSPTPTETSDGR